MSLKELLLEDMKSAMKEREAGKLRLSVIRLLRAAIQNEEISKNRVLEDEELLDVVAREVKKRSESIPDYQKAGRDHTVKQLQEEIEILQTYLPKQLSEDEIRLLITETIRESGASGPQDVGKVMKGIIPKTRGRADGKLVSEMVKEILKK